MFIFDYGNWLSYYVFSIYPNKKPWLDSQKKKKTMHNNNAFCWLIPCNQNQMVPENCNAWLET